MTDQMKTTFKWVIKQFDIYPHFAGESLVSPKFSVGPYEFCLCLYPRGEMGMCGKNLTLHLQRLNDRGATKVSVVNEICLDKGEVCTNFCQGKNTKIFKKNESWSWERVIDREEVLERRGISYLTNNDNQSNNLIITCKVLSLYVTENNENDRKLLSNEQDSRVLSEDLADLRISGIHSDITICVENYKFYLHRAVLECRCPQLMKKIKETDVENEYTLQNMKISVMHILLDYLYAGTCKIHNMYEEIYVASNNYRLLDLRNALHFPYISKSILASTDINVSRLSFEWVVSDLNKLEVGQELVYPAFFYSAYDWDKIKIILTCIKNENGTDGFQLKFQKMCSDIECFIRCKITFSGMRFHDTIWESEHLIKNDNWIPPLNLQSIFNENIFEDSFEMCFEISITNKEHNSKIEKVLIKPKDQKECFETIENLTLLQQDYQTLYSNSSLSDVILYVGDVKLPAHKVILCARSPVFAKMFEHDTLEKENNIIPIEDMYSATVAMMLQYIYCGKIYDMDIHEATRMYYAADKYELLDLKEKCTNVLERSIDAENFSNILLLADAHHDEYLKRCVHKYIISNPDPVMSSKNGLSVLNNRFDIYSGMLKALLEHISASKGKGNSESSFDDCFKSSDESTSSDTSF